MVFLIFELDALAAFLAVLAGIILFLSSAFVVFKDAASEYGHFSIRAHALQASEALIATSGGALGLAAYERNSLLPHQLNVSKIRALDSWDSHQSALALGFNGELAVVVKKANGGVIGVTKKAPPEHAFRVFRLATCGSEVCVVNVYAWND